MQRVRACASTLLISLVVIGCAKGESEAPPVREPAPEQPPPAPPPPTATASSAVETPSPATPAPGMAEPRDELKAGEKDEAEPQTLAEAEKALTTAKSTLDTLLGGAKTKPGGGATPLATGDARCSEACKAMSSLRRAASAVCRLAGEADARCTKAKGIVKDSETRVLACKCES